MKKRVSFMGTMRVFGMIMAICLAFTACKQEEKATGNNEGSNEVSKVEPAASTDQESETLQEEPITLNITWWGGQARHDYTQVLLDKYTELHPNITFEAVPSGWDGYFDKLATQAAAGMMPDIMQMDYLYISTYANNDSVADLTPFIENGTIDVSNIDPVLLNSGKIDDEMAGMVLSSALLTMAYNAEVLAEAGVAEPEATWTWTEYMEICKTVYDKTGKLGSETIFADNINGFNYYLRQNNSRLFREDNKALGYEDDQLFIEFTNMIKELVEEGAMPTPDQYETFASTGVESFPVVTGKAAFRTDWSNFGVRTEGANPNLKLITPPFTESGNKGLWLKPGMFFSVSQYSTDEKKQAAAEFINWFVNSEEANAIIMAERGTPVSSGVREFLQTSGDLSTQQNEMLEFVGKAVELSVDAPAPDPAGISEISEQYKNEVYSVLYGAKTAEEAAASFRISANEILERNN